MEFLPDEAKALEGAEEDTAEGGLVLLVDFKELLRGLKGFVTGGIANFGQYESSNGGA